MANPKAFFQHLAQHNVAYLVIDKIAAALHGVPVLAESIVIWPKPNYDNSIKLAYALESLGASLELEHGTVDREVTADVLRNAWRELPSGHGHRFHTRYGLIDVVFRPHGMETIAS